MLRRYYEILLLLFVVSLCFGCGQKRVVGPSPDMAAALDLRKALEQESGDTGKSEEQVQGTGWASLKGQFVFTGSPGAPKALVVDKDTAVCSKDGMQLFEQSLIVDESSKGLANVVVFLRKSSRVKTESATEKLVFDCRFR